MQHHKLIGDRIMEVDHFNPTLTQRQRNRYENLKPASRHSNGAKSDNWPSSSDRKRGLRFLDCCREQDYGKHIFEDPKTHELVGVTPAGRYHIEMCDLNAKHYVRERADRAALRSLSLTLQNIRIKGDLDSAIDAIRQFTEHVDLMIPPIPPPPTTT